MKVILLVLAIGTLAAQSAFAIKVPPRDSDVPNYDRSWNDVVAVHDPDTQTWGSSDPVPSRSGTVLDSQVLRPVNQKMVEYLSNLNPAYAYLCDLHSAFFVPESRYKNDNNAIFFVSDMSCRPQPRRSSKSY